MNSPKKQTFRQQLISVLVNDLRYRRQNLNPTDNTISEVLSSWYHEHHWQSFTHFDGIGSNNDFHDRIEDLDWTSLCNSVRRELTRSM